MILGDTSNALHFLVTKIFVHSVESGAGKKVSRLCYFLWLWSNRMYTLFSQVPRIQPLGLIYKFRLCFVTKLCRSSISSYVELSFTLFNFGNFSSKVIILSFLVRMNYIFDKGKCFGMAVHGVILDKRISFYHTLLQISSIWTLKFN